MSSITEMEGLSWVDRIKYILSLTDKTEIEQRLKQSSISSYDDLRLLIFLSLLMKNEKNLLDIFTNQSYPVEQRVHAGKNWLRLQKDQQVIHDFLVQTVNDKTIPRFMKNQILRNLNRIDSLKKSPSFFYDLLCRLNETNHHDQYNIDAYLLPFCSKDKIIEILSHWSITRIEQMDQNSPLYFKLVFYQPTVIIELIKNDINNKKNNKEKYIKYFRENTKIFEGLIKKQPKEIVRLAIEYVNHLEKYRRFLPLIIESYLEYLFKVVPNEIIELITIIAANEPGSIKYESTWSNDGHDLDSFRFPSSFSIENYIRLFFALYDTCKWSTNHTINLLQYMLRDKTSQTSLSALKKQRKWLIETVINERIGKEVFMKKLLKDGNRDTLVLLEKYSELTTPLSLHLLAQDERKGIVDAKQRLSLLCYQTMTQEIFDEFLKLFKKTGSDVLQRTNNYPLFLKCALSTNEQSVKNVLQWIEKRFTNEQLIVIENFLTQLQTLDNQFHLEILPNNFQSIQTIINLAFNHLQRSNNTLHILIDYGTFLLRRAEYYLNKEQKEKIQKFATQILTQCYSTDAGTPDSYQYSSPPLSQAYPEARQIYAEILVNDLFPRFVLARSINELYRGLIYPIEKAWLMPQIDTFLNKFFTESLPSSKKLQSALCINMDNSIVKVFLENRSTRSERINHLLKLSKLFFYEKEVQQSILRYQQHRLWIDQLLEDEQIITEDKLTNEESQFSLDTDNSRAIKKIPGFNIDLLASCSHLLTDKQQERITNIILNEYLQDKEISNVHKLKALRVLRRIPRTYNKTLQWIQTKEEDSQLVIPSNNNNNSRPGRGATAESLNHIIICLPATMDLPPEKLLERFEILKTKINAANAKYISDAMLFISRKVPDEIFLKQYLLFIQDEQFQKLGITANKEILRLLIEFVSNSDLVHLIIKPFWDKQPHQDVRTCLISTLLHFIGKTDDQTIIWQILEQATKDEYLPVIQTLFSASRGESRWPLTKFKNSSKDIYKAFINQIQFQVLDHPTSLEARSWAWSSIDYEYCDVEKLTEKAELLCIRFDKDGNNLWQNAFQAVLSCYKYQTNSSLNRIMEIIKKIMLCRDEIDSKENAIDNQHDLPVYHRIQRLLTLLNSYMDKIDKQKKASLRSITSIVFQFDKTLAPILGTLLVKITENKEELEDVFKILQDNLPEKYFEQVLTHLANVINDKNSCDFIQHLDLDGKLQLARWFIEEKHRSLVMFTFLKDSVFNQKGVDREQCQKLLRQLRQSDNLYLRQEAMEYTVPWNENEDNEEDDDGMSYSNQS
ncbi:hypothetical protein I4U23_006099 [Adineta vaga]|nr:hypothetical protein I4U23_006099 [Adineta vaga]